PLLEDLALACRARFSGTAPEFAPLPVQYVDYTLWQRHLLGSESEPDSLASREIRYWCEQLHALPVEISLPTDRPRPLTPTYRADALPVQIPDELIAALQARTRAAGATLFMGLQATLAALLARLG